MHRQIILSFFVSTVMAVGSTSSAQEGDDLSVEPISSLGGGCDDEYCGEDCDFAERCCRGRVYGLVEMTLFSYYRSDGNRIGDLVPGEQLSSEMHASMRYTAGYIAPGGLGVRARYWRFGHSSPSNDAATGMRSAREGLYTNTSNLDLELFKTIPLNCVWTAEISGGVRYNEFEETMLDDAAGRFINYRLNASDSFGGVAGLEAKRCMPIGSIYLGIRGSFLWADDAVRINETQNDVLTNVTRQQLELFGGGNTKDAWEMRPLFFAQVPSGNIGSTSAAPSVVLVETMNQSSLVIATLASSDSF
jgi:hypothetical protein